MVIGIGITSAVGGGVYFTYQEQADLFRTSSLVEIRNLNALVKGDVLTVTGNLKNVGSTSITELTIASISAGQLTVAQAPDGTLESYRLVFNDGAKVCFASNQTAKTGRCIMDHAGFSVDENGTKTASSLDGGATKAFKLKVLSGNQVPTSTFGVGVRAVSGVFSGAADNPDISQSIPLSERLTIQLGYTSGTDTLTSDVYNTRVKPG